MPIGVAIIGSGIFVKEEHLPAVQAIPDLISLKAIYSRSLKSAESTASGLSDVKLYADDAGPDKSYEKLLSDPSITAVIIALPIPAQPAYIKAALGAGKHVLAEKPIAKDVSTAQELLKWYHDNIDTKKTTWSVAENFRYMSRFRYGGEQVQQLGRVLGFRHRLHTFVKPGSKYYETAWRKTPEYQGGFLLDGGVHFIAGLRLMLGRDARIKSVSAYTTQLQDHLPPIDTVDATCRLLNGAQGTFSVSFGTTFAGAEWIVACEKGTVEVERGRVIVKKGEQEEEVKEFPEDGNGVKQEVKAWAEGIACGEQDGYGKPEEALRDLEILEAMIESGEQDGAPRELKLQ